MPLLVGGIVELGWEMLKKTARDMLIEE